MYKIEKGIELPKVQSKYPFGEMEVGDSFAFEGPRHRVDVAAKRHAVRHGKKFSVRKIGEGRFRVWRIE